MASVAFASAWPRRHVKLVEFKSDAPSTLGALFVPSCLATDLSEPRVHSARYRTNN